MRKQVESGHKFTHAVPVMLLLHVQNDEMIGSL